jgi:hypothetical protein
VVVKKQCEGCGDAFEANARLGERQRVCGKEACRQWRAEEGKREWRAERDNKEYFKGAPDRHRPGYWKDRRADPSKARFVEANRRQTRERMAERRRMFATQDSIRRNPVEYLNFRAGLRRGAVFATQDSITRCLYGVIVYLRSLPRPFATQDSIGEFPDPPS